LPGGNTCRLIICRCGGSSFIVKQSVYRNFDFERATALVDAALKLPPIADASGRPTS
jgi:hypothetical protein